MRATFNRHEARALINDALREFATQADLYELVEDILPAPGARRGVVVRAGDGIPKRAHEAASSANTNAILSGCRGIRLAGRHIQCRLEQQAGMCPYCGIDIRDTYCVDHTVPRDLGGLNTPANILLVCTPCSGSKADEMPDNFANRIQFDTVDDMLEFGWRKGEWSLGRRGAEARFYDSAAASADAYIELMRDSVRAKERSRQTSRRMTKKRKDDPQYKADVYAETAAWAKRTKEADPVAWNRKAAASAKKFRHGKGREYMDSLSVKALARHNDRLANEAGYRADYNKRQKINRRKRAEKKAAAAAEAAKNAGQNTTTTGEE